MKVQPYRLQLPFEFWTEYCLREKAQQWCKENAQGSWEVLYTVVKFQDEQDAVAFALRWL